MTSWHGEAEMAGMMIPGDPEVVAGLAAELRSSRGRIEQVAARLAVVGEMGWEGDAAEAFGAEAVDVPADLDIVAARFARVGRALEAFATELRAAQNQATQARRRAEQAVADRLVALSGVAQIEAHERRCRAQAESVLSGAGDFPPGWRPALWDGPDYFRLLNDAEAELAAAWVQYEEALAHRDAAAERCGAAIDDAGRDDLADDGGGFFAGFQRAVGAAVDAVLDVIETIAPVLTEIAGQLGLAALLLSWVPVVGPALEAAALTCSVLVLAIDLTLAAAGRQGFGPVALGVIGLACFRVSQTAGRLRVAGASDEAASGYRVVDVGHFSRPTRWMSDVADDMAGDLDAVHSVRDLAEVGDSRLTGLAADLSGANGSTWQRLAQIEVAADAAGSADYVGTRLRDRMPASSSARRGDRRPG
jgi:uncharacterized protein YukE